MHVSHSPSSTPFSSWKYLVEYRQKCLRPFSSPQEQTSSAHEHKDLRLPRINFSPIIPAIIPGPRKQPSREVGIKVGKHVLPLGWIWK